MVCLFVHSLVERSTHSLAAFITVLVSLVLVLTRLSAVAQGLHPAVMSQIRALQQEKAGRSRIELKMDSQFVYALKRSHGRQIALGVTTLQPAVKYQAGSQVLVDLNTRVTPDLLNRIRAGGGTVIGSFPRFNALRPLLPVAFVATFAGPGER